MIKKKSNKGLKKKKKQSGKLENINENQWKLHQRKKEKSLIRDNWICSNIDENTLWSTVIKFKKYKCSLKALYKNEETRIYKINI